MIKLFFTGLIIYGIYKFFIAPANLSLKDSNSAAQQNNSKQPAEDVNDEYIDYEEVD